LFNRTASPASETSLISHTAIKTSFTYVILDPIHNCPAGNNSFTITRYEVTE